MIFKLIIDGDSADELFAVGPEDLMNHFLPKHLNVKKEDVIKCYFEELTDEEKEKMRKGEKYTIIKHQDNYKRNEK